MYSSTKLQKNRICQQFHIVIGSQLTIDGLVGGGGKVEHRPLLPHDLKDADFRKIALACGEDNLVMLFQKV